MAIELTPVSRDGNNNIQSYSISLRPAVNNVKIAASEGNEISQDDGATFHNEIIVRPNPGQKPPKILKTILVKNRGQTINDGTISHMVLGDAAEAEVVLKINEGTAPPQPPEQVYAKFPARELSFKTSKAGQVAVKSILFKTAGIQNIELAVAAPFNLSADNKSFSERVSMPLNENVPSSKEIYIRFQPAADGLYTQELNVRYNNVTSKATKLKGNYKKRNFAWLYAIIAVLVIASVTVYVLFHLPHLKKNDQVPGPSTMGAINGPGFVCVGQTISLTDTSSNGQWQSSDIRIAVIDQQGDLTGKIAGTVTVTYCKSMFQLAKKSITVNAVPQIIGPLMVEVGKQITLNTNAGNGTWLSNDSSFASVNIRTGIVTGKKPGKTNIVFESKGGCATEKEITVIIGTPAKNQDQNIEKQLLPNTPSRPQPVNPLNVHPKK